MLKNKIFKDVFSALIQVESWKKEQEKIVFTNGCFDILHPGHITYLEDAKALGDRLIIGLNSDASVKRLKGENRPVNNEEIRNLMLAGLESVDGIVVFDEDTPAALIEQLTPDVLVKGGDYQVEDIVGGDHVKENGGEVKTIPFLEGYSTSNMIQKIIDSYGKN